MDDLIREAILLSKQYEQGEWPDFKWVMETSHLLSYRMETTPPGMVDLLMVLLRARIFPVFISLFFHFSSAVLYSCTSFHFSFFLTFTWLCPHFHASLCFLVFPLLPFPCPLSFLHFTLLWCPSFVHLSSFLLFSLLLQCPQFLCPFFFIYFTLTLVSRSCTSFNFFSLSQHSGSNFRLQKRGCLLHLPKHLSLHTPLPVLTHLYTAQYSCYTA